MLSRSCPISTGRASPVDSIACRALYDNIQFSDSFLKAALLDRDPTGSGLWPPPRMHKPPPHALSHTFTSTPQTQISSQSRTTPPPTLVSPHVEKAVKLPSGFSAGTYGVTLCLTKAERKVVSHVPGRSGRPVAPLFGRMGSERLRIKGKKRRGGYERW